jgi:nicotinate-nucleotide adenylyltransferase
VRLGIFGGTFDPPHVGHLLAASDAIEHLTLDRLVFVPASVQPLKAGRETASAGHRLAMVRLMVGADARLQSDSVEVDREGLSYTVDTLREFARRFPSADRYFLVGADVLASFAQWRDPQTVLDLATLAVLTRRADSDSDAISEATQLEQQRMSARGSLPRWAGAAIDIRSDAARRYFVNRDPRSGAIGPVDSRIRHRCRRRVHQRPRAVPIEEPC